MCYGHFPVFRLRHERVFSGGIEDIFKKSLDFPEQWHIPILGLCQIANRGMLTYYDTTSLSNIMGLSSHTMELLEVGI
jgi:hypothetical protein